MPAFELNGRVVVWFAGRKTHCSIYPLTDNFLAAHPDELADDTDAVESTGACVLKPEPPDILAILACGYDDLTGSNCDSQNDSVSAGRTLLSTLGTKSGGC